MNKNKGFTLIELVVVIVILGILAAVAVPRFADLQGDARNSVVEGALGAVKSASAIAHAKALVSGETGATGTVTLEGTSVSLVHGYPAETAAGIESAVDLDQITATAITDAMVFNVDDVCFTYEAPASSGASPSISDLGTTAFTGTTVTGCS